MRYNGLIKSRLFNHLTQVCTILAGATAIYTALTAAVPMARAQVTEKVLYNLKITDGSVPDSPLLLDLSGAAGMPLALYGTSEAAGKGHGTAYMLTAPKKGQRSWTETTLWDFLGRQDGDKTDGSGLFTQAKRISARTALFGTTDSGGLGYGTVFSLAGSTLTTIWSFTDGTDGGNPGGATPVADTAGALYVGTQTGGAAVGCGTVIQLIPPSSGQTAWTENTIWSFTGQADGCHSNGLIIGTSGVLTGTAITGGSSGCDGGCGTVFQLTPPASGQTAWTEKTLWQFQGYQSDGSAPLGTLVPGKKGEFYGVTEFGGDLGGGGSGNGAIYALSPPTKDDPQWTEKVVLNCGSGSCPAVGGVIIDATGALYGTTPFGGANLAGSVFKLTPPAKGHGAWTNTLLYSFARGKTGWVPEGPLNADKNGILYGTLSIGGTGNCEDGCGLVFSLAGTGFTP